MSHKQWEDLIPFYVAHTLPPDQAVALNQHIATCEYCQHVLADWRGIAAATRSAVEDWSRDLPPLSAQVRASIAPDATSPTELSLPVSPATDKIRWAVPPPAPPTVMPLPLPVQGSKPQPRRNFALVQAAAAVIVFILLGAGLFAGAGDFLSRLNTPASEVAVLSTATPDNTAATNPFLLVTPRPTITVMPSLTPITPEAATPTTTIPPATEITQFDSSATQEFSTLLMATEACYAANNTSAAIALTAGPGVNYDTIEAMQPGASMRVLVYTLDGWYQLMSATGKQPYWVYGGAITLTGDCERLYEPTSIPLPDGSCVGVGSEVVNIYVGPGDNYPMISAFNLAERPTAGMTSDNGWVQLRQLIAGSTVIGWTNQAALEGNCAGLPYIPAANFVPQPLNIPHQSGETAAPRIEAFSASAQTAIPGQTITLSWTVSGVDRVKITDDSQTIQSNNLPAISSTTMTLPLTFNASITLTLSAFKPGNTSDFADVTSAITLTTQCPSVYFLFDQNCQQGYQDSGSAQRFERGWIIRRNESPAGLVLFDDGRVGEPRLSDLISGTPPDGFSMPGDVFLPFYRTALGWATGEPQNYTLFVQRNLYDPNQPTQRYQLNLPDGRLIQLQQATVGNFISWSSVNP